MLVMDSEDLRKTRWRTDFVVECYCVARGIGVTRLIKGVILIEE